MTMMRVSLKKCVYYLKNAGTCIFVIGGCWFVYQLRFTSQILRSCLPVNVLNLEQSQAQYIYIDHPDHDDLSIFLTKDDPSTVAGVKPYKFSNIIFQWWKSMNESLMYKLLSMAKHGNDYERFRAICHLNELKYLKDWHYENIAKLLDAKTAVALARMPDVNIKFFLKPPYFHMKKSLHDIIDEMHKFLLKLNSLCITQHSCLSQFLNKKFGDLHRDGSLFDHDLISLRLAATPAVIWDRELLQDTIKALYHHSTLEQYSKDLVNAGGLPILMDIQKIFHNDTDFSILLAQILSNVSLHIEFLEEIFVSGWVGILANWSHHEDIRVSIPAVRALSNLDMNNDDEKYLRQIYILHPLHRNHATPKLDVIFLHGLLGGVFITWRQRDPDTSTKGVVDSQTIAHGPEILSAMNDEHSQEFLKDLAKDLRMYEWEKIGEDFEIVLDDCPTNTNGRACGPYTCSGCDSRMIKANREQIKRTSCWPMDWLPKDIPFLRIIGVNYDTNLSMWSPSCPIENMKSTISERSDEYVKNLFLAGVGKRPIIWVCHSMGGLLVKKMLVEEWKRGDKSNICKNTRGIVFYSTPHQGSHLAALTQTTQMLVWPSIEVQELREASPPLLKLHKEFLNMLKDHPMDVVSFCETKPTLVTTLKFQFLFVSPESADPGVGEFFQIPQDHLSICKPANRKSFLYQKLINMIEPNITYNKKRKNSFIDISTLIRKL